MLWTRANFSWSTLCKQILKFKKQPSTPNVWCDYKYALRNELYQFAELGRVKRLNLCLDLVLANHETFPVLGKLLPQSLHCRCPLYNVNEVSAEWPKIITASPNFKGPNDHCNEWTNACRSLILRKLWIEGSSVPDLEDMLISLWQMLIYPYHGGDMQPCLISKPFNFSITF